MKVYEEFRQLVIRELDKMKDNFIEISKLTQYPALTFMKEFRDGLLRRQSLEKLITVLALPHEITTRFAKITDELQSLNKHLHL